MENEEGKVYRGREIMRFVSFVRFKKTNITHERNIQPNGVTPHLMRDPGVS